MSSQSKRRMGLILMILDDLPGLRVININGKGELFVMGVCTARDFKKSNPKAERVKR